MWPPARTGLHPSKSECITGPPTFSGFPFYTGLWPIAAVGVYLTFRKSHAVLPPGLWPIAAVGVSVKVRICSICMSGRVSRLVCVVGRRVCPTGCTGDLRVGFPQTPNEGILCSLGWGALTWPRQRAMEPSRGRTMCNYTQLCQLWMQLARSPLSERQRHDAPAHHTCSTIIFMLHTPHSLEEAESRAA